MKLTKNIGLALFVGAISLFTSLLFIGKYSVDTSSIGSLIADAEIAKTLQRNLKNVNGKTISKFEYQTAIKTAIEKTNADLYNKYAVSEAEVEAIAKLVGNKYDLEKIKSSSIFPSATAAFKIKLLEDNTGWMQDQNYATSADLKQAFSQKVNELSSQIIQNKGVNKYAAKSLNTAIARQSITGFASHSNLLFWLTFGLGVLGVLLYVCSEYLFKVEGIKNNGIYQSAATNRGWVSYIVFGWLVSFYILLYFYNEWMIENIMLVDWLSQSLSGNLAGEWFLYGFLYCVAMTTMAVRMFFKYQHNMYQIIRTCSVLFFQICLAFLLPEIMVKLNMPWYDFKNMWPLDYDFFFNGGLLTYESGGGASLGGTMAKFMFIWGIALFLVGMPILVYFFGKRWYCSWVCGCGGLAETLGDPYRQLSDKSLKAWKYERYIIHGVLVFAFLMTGVTIYTLFSGNWSLWGMQTADIQATYSFLIGSVFSGIIGTGFYPVLGNRIWCRFGCPLAAYMGLIQRFKSKFRITTNGGQCISCGNCSTYCEQGIDVRAYAQKGQNIVRASCVGCGVCSAVCPRGVLKLENGSNDDGSRMEAPAIILGNDGPKIAE